VQSLILGLGAALLWGLHDFTVRRIGGRADVSVLLLMALVFGTVWLAPFAFVAGGWDTLTAPVTRLALVSGACFACAGYGLYRAFAIGPVRLVAPICGAYPVLSVAFAVARGQEAGALVWLGVLAVVGGIALVARGESDGTDDRKTEAILWAVLSCVGFAATFGLSQWAAEGAADLPVSLVQRLGAVALVLAVITLRRPDMRPALAMWPTLLMMGALDVGALTLVTVAGGFANPEFASVSSSIFGLVTILLAWRLLAEAMTPPQWLGVATVFGGIFLLGTT
jgi:drug/metabolite transporter (DMT)-like permease